MQYTALGNTGLTVSVAGLGCGGNSRIGLGAGLSTAQSVALVREAFDLGVTFFDTAEAYGTEELLGRAFSAADRAKVVFSTKGRIRRGNERLPPARSSPTSTHRCGGFQPTMSMCSSCTACGLRTTTTPVNH